MAALSFGVFLSKPVYFISDIHLGEPYPQRNPREKEDALIAFLQHVRERADTLYIVGDLFDFWFEYKRSVPTTGARVVFELYAAVQGGLRIVSLPGNHDIWIGDYLSRQVGLELPGGPVDTEIQGRRVLIAHGDEFREDLPFRISRGILKSSFCIRLFSWIHPDVGVRLGRWTSHLSEARTGNTHVHNRRVYTKAANRLLAGDADVVVFGHYHAPIVEQLDGGTLIVLGDWVIEDSYAVLEDGTFRLMRWENGKGVEVSSTVATA